MILRVALSLLLMISFHSAFAKKSKKFKPTPKKMSLSFEYGKENHTYKLQKIGKKQKKYLLTFKRGNEKLKAMTLSNSRGDKLFSKANSLLWESKYRMPASVKKKKKCKKTFGTLKVRKENSKICLSDNKSYALTFNLINQLGGHFLKTKK